MARVVVFAYHDVGVRCLCALLAHGVRPSLIFTHRDEPQENLWFASVSEFARQEQLEFFFVEDLTTEAIHQKVAALNVDFIFSFYYRKLLPPSLLALASRGAYNMHGSLLPQFRGRAPVNWALLEGASETGVTLHSMVAAADAGDIVGQKSVPIFPNDDAANVMHKVTWAAEALLFNLWPTLLAGRAHHIPQDLSQGRTYGRRTAEDGRINWQAGALAIHNLVRAVAPPYPGAFTEIKNHKLKIFRTRLSSQPPKDEKVGLYASSGQIFVDCTDRQVLRILHLCIDNVPVDYGNWCARFGVDKIQPF